MKTILFVVAVATTVAAATAALRGSRPGRPASRV